MSTASSSSSLLYISVLLLVLIHSSIQEGFLDRQIKELKKEINDAEKKYNQSNLENNASITLFQHLFDGIMLENPNNTENIRKYVNCETHSKNKYFENKLHSYIRGLTQEINREYSNFSKTALEKLKQLKSELKPFLSDSEIEKMTCTVPKVVDEKYLDYLVRSIIKKSNKPFVMTFFNWKIDVLSLVLEEMKQPVMKQSTDLPSFAKKEKKRSVNKRKVE
uniref:Uncharacterized protein n=1 Tax=Schistosoma japonicum TaxID=6182 RepID=C1LGV5_SCHJA|nr:hypothetical protein [Schistosoma japonicum]